ncbi:MAG: phenylalanine--tRNA ligase subunit beta [Acholeplasmatales bacterium]|nr:MAG: phenylalanine--tRNA ligase subunit beta [Acholeplasmatales bacterium]
MNISMKWLKELIPCSISPEELGALFTVHSQEVARVEALVRAKGLTIGHVLTCRPHPQADSLRVCEVDVGDTVLGIVCGAPNVAAEQRVIVARPGAVLPGGITIEHTVIRGEASAGMICSLSELGIDYKYHHEDGIHVVRESVAPGSDALEALHFDDTVIGLDLTPNRADLLSMHGVAYDVAAMLDLPLTLPHVALETAGEPAVHIRTQTPRCLSYYGRVLKSIVIKPSPQFMQARLIAAGVRPINNVVDITNYVMLETGQPLHAFDYDALDSDTIVVREAEAGETFVTLDDKERTLHAGDILITNGREAVALGGVMGGAATEVTSHTTRLLLEAAVFDAMTVGKTSRRLDLRSESSLRFERKVDPEKTRYALDRATALFIEYANAEIVGDKGYFDDTSNIEPPIVISLEKINAVLGGRYSDEHVDAILKRLHLPFTRASNTYTIDRVSRRQDLLTYQDIIEEIGRISGYDQLPNTLPSTVAQGALSLRQQLRRRIRAALTGLGLDEVVTYSLQSVDRIGRFSTLHEAPVKVADPMTDLHAALIHTPLTGLYDVATHNAARRQHDVNIFELGTCYTAEQETERLAILMSGHHHYYRWQKTPTTDFYTLKGVFEALLDTLGLPAARYEPLRHEDFHPYQTARILLEGTPIGIIGKVHPKTTADDHLGDVFVLDVDVSILLEKSPDHAPYQPLQKYPSIERDLALVCDRTLPAETVLEAIKTQGGAALVHLDVFDVYTGEHLDENQKSLGLRLLFEDPEKTLESKTVDALVDKIVAHLKVTYGMFRR